MTTSPTHRWSRRGFLTTSGAAALTLGLASGGGTAAGVQLTADADEFAALRARWRTLLLGEGFSPTAEPFRTKLAALGATARRHLDALDPKPGSLWPDAVWADPEPDKDQESYGYSGKIQESATRLRTLAEAYCRPGTGLTGDAPVREKIIAAFAHLIADVYHEGQAPYGNWYSWEIGAPQPLLDVAVLLHEHLDAEQIAATVRAVDHFVPDSKVANYTGTSTGANRIDLCRVLALRGVLDGTAAKVALARDAMSPTFPYVTKGDGLYADGSLIQHTNVPYTGSYGAVLIDGTGRLLALLDGSSWQVTDPKRQLFLDAVEAAYAPFLHDGLMMDGVSGRAISRGLSAGDPSGVQQDDHLRGHAVIGSVLVLAQGASAAEAARWKALAKGWLTRDRYADVTTGRTLGVAALSRVNALLADAAVKAAPEALGHRLFPSMDRAVHRTRTFTASLSMASKRITYYENGNGENVRGWHTGTGMLYWWAEDANGGQYSDGYWPTVDPYRLPGTTASLKKLADGEGGAWGAAAPATTWVGGTSDGTYATLAQHLLGLSSTLRARKSWFFLDDAVVCLGAGITAADGTGVQTVVDNRCLGADGTAGLVVDGRVRETNGTVDGAGWAHLEGHAGYVFPGGAPLTTLREERTGAWKDINGGGATTPVTRRYVTLTADHGTDPTDASYAYVVLPGASRQRTEERAADRDWLLPLANSARVQGIRVPSLGFTGVTFWEPGTAGKVTVDAPVCVQIVERGDGTAVVSVSDPNRAVQGFHLTWDHPVRTVLSKPSTVTSAGTGTSLSLTFGDLSGTGGGTQRVVVQVR
ncbi:polysaccharide lyase 8 family protein [Streptomyces cavernicola]|uniref:Polysaccharide lyase 8 family protein n=1 Tax=Streptomyces cavernicola TaxID=3043613 RepID=A0ABT6SBM1_9ACTN|nr:polysaccharide lyase 8 family protein [Streptomyces sp. B-S-A6]MDI3405314.1 polysaccharide lyase 8 family protein [Streptomyces sp. B-S-A6]